MPLKNAIFSCRHADSLSSPAASRREFLQTTSVAWFWWIGPLGASLTVGCQNLVRRGQSPEGLLKELETAEAETSYVGRITAFRNLDFSKMQGVGLVVDLKGTGTDPGPSWQRDRLEDDLALDVKNSNPKGMISSPDSAMVKVIGYLPPGCRKGDRVDLEIEILEKTDGCSLVDGNLMKTILRPVAVVGARIKTGNLIGTGQGGVLPDSLFETREDLATVTRGIVLGGGVSQIDRNLQLLIHKDHKGVKTTAQIANAINQRFTTVTAGGRIGVAEAKNDGVIDLLVPEAYRENVGRYTQVLTHVAYGEVADKRVNRIERLDVMLNQPNLAKTACLRLEAVGNEATSILKRAVKNPDAEVSLQSAVTLAYLGQPDGVDVLVENARQDPAFRWDALAALVALRGSKSIAALEKIMQSDSAEAKYGAFRALKTISPEHPLVKGQILGGSFYFHEVPYNGTALVHFSRSKYPEVVIFGTDISVDPSVLFVKSGLTIRGAGPGQIEINRFTSEGKKRRLCSTNAAELIRALAEMGGNYGAVLEFFRTIKQQEKLSAKLAINALPKLNRVRTEIAGGESDVPLEEDASPVSE